MTDEKTNRLKRHLAQTFLHLAAFALEYPRVTRCLEFERIKDELNKAYNVLYEKEG